MQCIFSFNKNSPLFNLTFNICIYSCLQLNLITVFSMSTRFGISSRHDLSSCVELLQRLQLEINCLNGKKRKMIKPIQIRKVLYSALKCFFLCSLRLTFKCNGFLVWFKRLHYASKNDWIQACMLFWTLPIPTGYKLKLKLHTHTHRIATCSHQ